MSYTRFAQGFCSVGLFVALSVVQSRQAFAEVPTTDTATAQALFDQGRQLMTEGKYAEACPKFAESARIASHGGTLLNLGDCYEKQGRLASAWSAFINAASAANRSGHAERETEARGRAEALAAKLSKIVITVNPEQQSLGIEVKRDATPVGQAQWGVPIPIDSGKHSVTASLSGYQTWDAQVEIKTPGEIVKIEVPPLQKLTEGAVAPTEPRSTHQGAGSTGLGSRKKWALVAGGVGTVGVVVGSVFGLVSMSKHKQSDEHCDGAVCRDQTGVDQRDSARSAGNVSTIGFIVGAVGLAGGATLWFTAPKSESATALVVGPGSMLVKGSF